MLTGLLMIVVVGVSLSFFFQNRSHHEQLVRQRAQIHARYCSEYAVSRYGVPTFLSNPEQYETGNASNNWLYPVSAGNIINNDFQDEDDAHAFSFGYDSLKMDLIYDVASGRPFYYLSALGEVSWMDREGDHTVKHRSALALNFNDFSRFMYFSNGEVSPEGNLVTFKAGDEMFGRVHVNGQINISMNCCPVFHGLVTQTAEEINGISEGQIPGIFQGGLIMPFPEIEWPPYDAIEQIKEQRTPGHTYDASVEIVDGPDTYDQPLTTYLKFNGTQYHAAQYWSDSLDADGDTIYHQESGQDWVSKGLPVAEGHELIWVQGVCRLEGMVRGKITVLSSDSMFIMDNIYVQDTDIYSCGQEDNFGMVPLGSPNRIGLASEKDIIVATTLPNGAFNGRFSGPTCGYVDDSNLSSCGQTRKDVVITAALFAVECSFEAEFWKTSALGATWPPPQTRVECPGENNTNHQPVVCAGAPPLQDERGTIWICGSVVQSVRGFVYRNNPGPWGQAWIGYFEKKYRYDDNFISGGPPVWFRVKYSDGTMDITTAMVVPDYDRWLKMRASNLVD